MGFVALAAAVALAVVLVVSGAAKLLDRAGTRQAVAGFGVPAPLVAPVATGLVPAELLTAVLLVVPASRVVGLVLAGLLLAAFTTAVVLALRAGRRPECHCFGRIGGADVSGRTVARNLVLLLLAVAGLAGSEADLPDGAGRSGAMVVGVLLAAGVLLAEGLAGAAARRRRAAEDEEAFGVVGSQALPEFEAATLTGRTSREALLAPGLPVLLVTLTPGCGPCMSLRPDIAAWAQVLRDWVTVVVLAHGTAEANQEAYADDPGLTVVLDAPAVQEALGIHAAPPAGHVGPDGRATSGVASGEQLVRRLLVTAATGFEAPEHGAADADPGAHDLDGRGEDALRADDLDLGSVVTPRPGLVQQGLAESTLVLDPVSGATVALDQTGALVWSVLDGTSRLEEIVADLADAYGHPVEVIGPDVLSLVQSLGRAGLLLGVAPDLPPGEDDEGGHGHVADPSRTV
jgi:hypothetical protein